MHFNSVLISSFFASAVLAAPGRERSLSAETPPDSIWAGNVVTLENGTIQYVTSTIHAPDIAGQKVGSSGYAYIGIDGAGACLGGMLQLGVVFNVTTDGPSYTPVYRYGARGSEGFFNDVHIAARDAIKLIVNAPVDAKLGNVTVQNLSNNQKATHQFNLIENLCGKTAEWVVEELTNEDPTSQPVNFGTLTFANAEIGGNDFGQLDREIVNIAKDGIPFTSVSVDNDSIVVKWL